MAGLASQSVITQLTSVAQATGLFRAVNGHEPKSAPEAGLSASVWVNDIRPAVGRSGLSATSARVTFMMRLYTPMLTEPQDVIDPTMTAATDALFAALTADVTLNGTVRNIDVLGSGGEPLSARAGYVELGGALFRVIDISIPCIINDAWPQGM